MGQKKRAIRLSEQPLAKEFTLLQLLECLTHPFEVS